MIHSVFIMEKVEHERCKPVRILQKRAGGWSFPGQVVRPPRHSFRSSSHRPSKQQMIMLHTHTCTVLACVKVHHDV